MPQPITRQALHAQLEELIADEDADALRALLHAMADECHPRERTALLERIRRNRTNATDHPQASDLDGVITELQRALAIAKDEADRDPPHPDEEEDWLGPFADVMPQVHDVLECIGSELTHGRAEVARSAYERVWDLLDIEDGFGRGPALEAEDRSMAREHAARYLRSVYLACPLETRIRALAEAAERVRFVRGFSPLPRGRYVSLREIAEAGSDPLPEWTETLTEVTSVFAEGADALGDFWLREATQASQGLSGMEALAERDGVVRPLAWLDAMGMAVNQEQPERARGIWHRAEAVFAPGAPVLADLADLAMGPFAQSAPELLPRVRSAAFIADPSPERLLELWQALPTREDRTTRLTEAAEHLASGRQGSPSDAASARPPVTDPRRLAFPPPGEFPETEPAALAFLFAGEWDRAAALVPARERPGADADRRTRPAVFVHALTALSLAGRGHPGGAIQSLLTKTLAGGLPPLARHTHELPNGDPIGQRARPDPATFAVRYVEAVQESLADRPLSADERDVWMARCRQTAIEQCERVVTSKRRREYPQAAAAIAAVYEAARACGEQEDGEDLVCQARSRHSGYPAFQRALREALAETS